LSLNARNSNDYANLIFRNSGGSANWAELVATTNTLAFKTATTERMRIDSSGRVGINRVPPAGALSLEVMAPSGYSLGAGFHSPSTQSTIEFKDTNTTANYKVRVGSQTDDLVMFAGGELRMRITSGGNVGIGTDSPVAGLHVAAAGLQGYHAWFGATGFVNNAAYHYDFAKVGFSVDDQDGADTGAGFSFTTRNSGDSNWQHGYIYQPQDGGIAFGTGGAGTTAATERMRITNGGDVGIGATSPSAKLHIYNSNGGDATSKASMLSEAVLKLQPHATNSTNLLFAQVNGGNGIGLQVTNGPATANWDLALSPFGGNVGIGTVSPSAKLEIEDTTSRTGTTASLIVEGRQDGAANVLTLRSKDFSAPTVGIGANHGALMRWQGFDGNDFENMGYIFVGADGQTVADGDAPSYMSFGTSGDGLSSPTERMRITSGGNVGIGTTSPSTELHVKAPSGYAELRLQGASGSGSTVEFYDDTTKLGDIYIDPSKNIVFRNASESMKITSGGSVGIGATSPSNDVSGLHIAVASSTDQLYLERTGSATGKWWLGTANNSLYFFDTVANDFRMIINSSGNVGIGTTSPTNKLTVSQNYAYETSTTVHNNAHIKLQEDTASTYITNINGITYLSTAPQKGADRGALIDGNTKSATIKISGRSVGTIQFKTGSGTTGTIISENTRMIISNDGNVGIGTTSPTAAKLDVAGAVNVTGGTIISGVDVNANVGVAINRGKGLYSNDGSYLRKIIEHTSGNDIAIGQGGTSLIGNITFQPGSSGDIKFYPSGGQDVTFASSGNVGIGTTSPNAKLKIEGSGFTNGLSIKSAGNSGTYPFMVTYASGTEGDAFCIDDNLNVGIGITSPSALLHVFKSSHPNALLARFENPSGEALVEIKAQNDALSVLQFADSEDGNVGAIQYSHPENSMRFKTADAERMRIDSSGNVGIGTTSPTQKIQVDGNARINGGLLVNGDYLTKELDTPYFTNGVANLACNIQLGNNNFWGYIEVHITGSYSNQNTPGALIARYAVGTNPNNLIYANDREIIAADGPIKTNISLGNFQWDSGTSQYVIPISHIVSSGNGYSVLIKMFTHGGGATTVMSSLSISSLYTLTALPRLYKNINDRLGIGTDSPSAKLHVKTTNTTAEDVAYFGNNNITNGLAVTTDGNINWGFNARNTRNLTFSTNQIERMRIDSAGNVSFNLPSIGGTRELQFPAFNATNAKTIIRAVGTSDYRQHLDILMNTAQADIAPTPVVRIENSGNIGIGTNSPSTKLEVISSTNSVAKFISTTDKSIVNIGNTSSTTSYSSVVFESNSGLGQIWKAGTAYSSWGGVGALNIYNSAGPIAFHPNANANAMFLSTSGNVGIGTTGPSSKLHVNGLTQTSGIISLSRGAVSTPAAAGWYRVGVWSTSSNRGGGVLKLSTTGGSISPGTYVIKAYKNWSSIPTLKLEAYGSFGYINKARVQLDSTNSTYYLEVYKPVGYAVPFDIYFDGLLGYNPSLSAYTTGTLPNGTVGGTTYKELDFIPEGTSFEKIYASGNVGIGTASPSEKLHVVGNIKATGDVVAYSSSDERLKDNKKNIENALEKVESLNGVEFDWNDKQDVYEGHDIGIIAQEVEKIVPEIVNTRDNGYKAVKYEKLVPLLIEAIKELSDKVKALENK